MTRINKIKHIQYLASGVNLGQMQKEFTIYESINGQSEYVTIKKKIPETCPSIFLIINNKLINLKTL
jgi:hypothetical protein